MKIYLEPFGGLCNRMRTISSAYELAAGIGADLIIRWILDEDLLCSSKELFNFPDNIHIHEQKILNSANNIKLKIQRAFLKLKCNGVIRDDTIIKLRKEKRNYINFFKSYNKQGDIFIRTCESLREDFYYNDYSIFTPNITLASAANQRISSISENGKFRVIGLHIRRTDNQISIEKSPSDYYFQIIDTILKQDSKVRFYLATDSDEEKDNFHQKYNTNSRKIIFTAENIPLKRNSEEGMKAAYVELLCLSATERIYGSFYSSYSTVAAALSKKQIDLINKDNIPSLIAEIEHSNN